MMSLSLDWMFSLSPPLYTARGGRPARATVCFHYCPCRSYLRSLDTALFFFFKRIKTAPDTSIPTRGIEKHLTCRLPGLPPRMSASDEGEKNDALYGRCKKPFIQPQLSHRECVALTHGGWNRTSTDPVPAVPTLHNTSIDLVHAGQDGTTQTTYPLIQRDRPMQTAPPLIQPDGQTSARSCASGSVNTCTDETVHPDPHLSPRRNRYGLSDNNAAITD